jgi:hypothetical protein
MAPPDKIAAARQALIPRAGERNLRCTVEPILPALLYTAPEIAAGYTYSIPLAQYADGQPEHGWSVVAGFTPKDYGGAETYLAGHIDAPAPHRDTVSGSGTYWIGLGTYSVKLAVSDDTGRVCRKEWIVKVGPEPTPGALAGGDFIPAEADGFDFRTQVFLSRKKAQLGTPDGVVRTPPSHRETPASPSGQLPLHGLTILLDAPSDPKGQLAVVDAMEVLLARIPAQSVRLVAFNLQEGHEIFRQDGFQLDALGEVRESFASLGYHAVKVEELQTHPIMTPQKLLDSLVQRETHEAQRSDAVLFLGMEFGGGNSFRFSAAPPRPIPPFSYIHLLRPPVIRMLGPANPQRGPVIGTPIGMTSSPNLISWAVHELHGKTMHVGFNKEFDQAVEKLLRTIQTGRP